MDDVKIEIGYALPKERWNEAAEDLMKAGLMAAKYLSKTWEGEGKWRNTLSGKRLKKP